MCSIAPIQPLPGPTYSIVIPPPNVTGSLHMGHALNNTLQDVLIRYKRMDGHNALWVPGTDHAGIATQWVVRRQIEAEGGDFRALGRDALRRAGVGLEGRGRQTRSPTSSSGSGCRATGAGSGSPSTTDLQRAVTEHFVRLYEEGLIYRGQRLINWDPMDQTALSDLEVEHEEGVAAELWSFAYPIREADGGGEIVVATTRPETMLGDTAVAVHPDDERYQHLIGKTLSHPIVDREIPIVADAILVDPGVRHRRGQGHAGPRLQRLRGGAAPRSAHDQPARARRHAERRGGAVPGPDGRSRRATPSRRSIEELGLFRGTQDHTMSLGRSQRSGAVAEPMLSTQWFVRMKPLGAPALAAVEHGATRFVPRQWENTYFAWLRDIRDWCISRQLWWGHRIPAWYCGSAAATSRGSRVAPPRQCAACGGTALRAGP